MQILILKPKFAWNARMLYTTLWRWSGFQVRQFCPAWNISWPCRYFYGLSLCQVIFCLEIKIVTD